MTTASKSLACSVNRASVDGAVVAWPSAWPAWPSEAVNGTNAAQAARCSRVRMAPYDLAAFSWPMSASRIIFGLPLSYGAGNVSRDIRRAKPICCGSSKSSASFARSTNSKGQSCQIQTKTNPSTSLPRQAGTLSLSRLSSVGFLLGCIWASRRSQWARRPRICYAAPSSLR